MSLHRWIGVAAVIGGGVVAWACGSDGDNTDITGAQNDGGASSSGSTSSSGAASGSSGTGSSSGSSGTDGGTSSGAPGGDGGLNPPDAGPGGNTSAINCGATSCNLSTDVCCVTQTNAGRAYGCTAATPGCTVPDSGGGGGDPNVVSLKCSATANCPMGQVCCIHDTTAGAASECKASCSGGEEQLCDPNAADGGGCPQSAPCSNDGVQDLGLPKTFGICGGG